VRSGLVPGCSTVIIIIIIIVIIDVVNFTTLYRGAAVQYCTQAHCLMPRLVSRWYADGCDGVSLGERFPTFRFIFMDVFSGSLGRDGKDKSFLRNIFKHYANIHGVTCRKI